MGVNGSGQRCYQLGHVEVDASRGCIKLNGHEQDLRQKAFQLLLYLLEHRDRLVTKDELIENIWEGTAVSDDSLVQLIKEVRRTLGDDHRRPQFIKTVPKAGYRFIGPVQEVTAGGAALVETKEITTVEVEYEEEDSAARRNGDASRQRIALPPSVSTSGRRVVLFAVLAATPLAAIALAIYFRPAKRPLPEVALPQVPGKTTLAVMPFENLSGSRELDWLREGLADMVITDLSGSSKLTVLGRQQLHLVLERLGRDPGNEIQLDGALEVAQSSRAELVVLGSFAATGEAIHISANLYDARNNRALASERIVVEKPKDIITQVDLLSLKLASELGASSEGPEAKRALTDVMTDNLEAYRCYSLALEKAYGLHNVEAIALLEKAVSLDPQFAMAYARIGYAYGVGWNFGEKARPYLEKAFQLSGRLTEKDRLTITGWYAIAHSDFAGAIRTFQDIVSRYPLEVEAYGRLARLLQGEERFEEALEAAKRGVAVDPQSKELYNQLGGIYLDLNRYGEAVEAFGRYVALGPNEPNAHDSLGLSFQAVGRYDEAIQSYGRALAINPGFEVALVHLANTYFQQGRYREAISLYQRYIQIAPSDVERSRGYSCLCEAYLRRGNIDRAEEAVKLETKYTSSTSWHSLLVALQQGQETKVKRLEDQLFANWPSADRGQRKYRRFFHYYHGYLEFKSGRAAEAIESFKEALKHRSPNWDIDTFEDCLANAYLELGRLDEATAEYERVLSINPSYPLAHYHLAQAYERKGERERARADYERFLQIWKDADQDLREIKAATTAFSMLAKQ